MTTTEGPADADLRRHRRPEPAFARAIAAALGDARTVLEVGHGSTRYEPVGREVTAIDAPAGDALRARLPYEDDAFDAAVTAFTLDQWDDLDSGLAEVRRVTSGPIALLTFDPDRIEDHWLTEVAPEAMAAEARRWPSLTRIADALGHDTVTSTTLPIPFTCVDGFAEAYYARPERLLDAAARRATGVWDSVDEITARRSVAALRTALESGDWDRAHGALRVRPTYDGSVVLVVATPRLDTPT
ncbi:class I SAM-dependent methyltransferase [Curtobacterium pusillum]|uniref:class I SAM-dependent methyltransferase n=1 Tax=Curtobacterium pusillum TaxID=69373 RepID=UPI0011A47514|nr:class I SAM-dependent methyltransferase [Curtobacterium pusillum]